MSAVNETLIRDVVTEVLGRLNGNSGTGVSPVRSNQPTQNPHGQDPRATTACGCSEKNRVSGRSISTSGRGKYGVFQDANEACTAAHEGFLQLKQKGVAARIKVVEIVKTMAEANAAEWGRIEFEETKIGRVDHKIAKLNLIKLVPGVEWLHPDARSGDHGITLEEYTPFGLVAAITPSTHSIPTLSGNIVNIVAAGNSVVFNAHPSAAKCAAMAVREYNKAIERETGIQNLITIIETPTRGAGGARGGGGRGRRRGV